MVTLSERGNRLKTVKHEERPMCDGSCAWILVGDFSWRCERCLRYYAPKVLTQGDLF
jgi:hypothetical protein